MEPHHDRLLWKPIRVVNDFMFFEGPNLMQPTWSPTMSEHSGRLSPARVLFLLFSCAVLSLRKCAAEFLFKAQNTLQSNSDDLQ